MKIVSLGIAGLGLIGGSIASRLSALRSSPGAEAPELILGYDSDARARDRAVELGIVDRTVEDVSSLAGSSDLMVIAVPVGAIEAVAAEAAEALRPGAFVTDTGSAKESVVKALEGIDSLRGRYAGGHPMAGSEESGIDASKPDLFQGRPYAITPTPATSAAALEAVRWLALALGAVPIEIDPRLHDEAVAAVSHVPYLAACALSLAAVGTPRARELASSGFRDTTRVASGSPLVCADFCLANRQAVLKVLDSLVGALELYRFALESGDRSRLISLLDRARTSREEVVGLMRRKVRT